MASNDVEFSDSDVALLKRLGIDPESPLIDVDANPDGVPGVHLPVTSQSVATFPSDEEIILSLQQWYYANDDSSDELLNGSKPLHLLEVYDLVTPLYLRRLPSIGDLVKLVWKLIPSGTRKIIKEKARNATAADKASIAGTITSLLSTVLSSLGVPKIVIRTILGPLVRKAVDFIVKNVANLPD
ncbi:hypothetical protein GQX73_g9789 [Xylaria multiplex]|uniref:Uncharacterized protein n=1 Tax=Xylaria multiplex TaxID=323545 RepID=A0A7C8IHR0_9PEZI|nr:hypothetical protein GQX73_g9789 [Xylaria multiplex]